MLVTEQLTVAIDFHSMEKKAMEVNGYHQLFTYQHYSKYFNIHKTFLYSAKIFFPLLKIKMVKNYLLNNYLGDSWIDGWIVG